MMSKENWFVVGLLIGGIVTALLTGAISTVHRTNVEYRARVVMAEIEMEPLTVKAIRGSRAAILTAEDGQLFLYYEDSARTGSGRLYSVRPK